MADTKFQPGKSGNPNGRPPGKTLLGRLRQAVANDFDNIMDAIIAAAKTGDMTAASLLLSRTCPAMRPAQEPVKIDIAGDTLTAKANAIIEAVTLGALSVADAKELLTALAAVSKITEVDELVRRIEALENSQKAKP